MKRMHKTLLLITAGALLLTAACTSNEAAPELPDESGTIVLSLGSEGMDGTRAIFQNDKVLKWQEGDQVGVYMYSSTDPNIPDSMEEGTYGPWIAPFSLASGAGTGNGQFAYHIIAPQCHEAYGHVALYPFNWGHKYSLPTSATQVFPEKGEDGTIMFHLPTEWQGLQDLNMVRIPMAANLDDGAAVHELKHIGGAVKVTLKNVPAGARYFKLTADKNISGDFVIKKSEIGTGVLRGEGSANWVQLTLEQGAGKALESVDIYFPVPVGTYKFGLGVYGDGIVYYQNENGTTSNTIERGTILRMPTITLEKSQGETGTGDYDPDFDSSQKKSGLTYQLLLYSFADSNGDGYGDIKGVTQHLDYLDALGVTAIWLSPIHPAQSYHGYDVTNYDKIAPRYGTMADFRELVREAHKRNIRIYMDYVINHSGDRHEWFLDAIQNGPDSQYWGYYNITKTPKEDVEAGLVDQVPSGWYKEGAWHPVTAPFDGGIYYYYSEPTFGTGMFVDYNYWKGSNCEDSPAFGGIVATVGSWLDRGVDGLRLDAVKHIYEDANSYDNILFWKKFYEAVNSLYGAYIDSRSDLTGKSDENIFMVGEVLDNDGVCRKFYEGLPSMFDFDFWWQLDPVLNYGQAGNFCGNMCDRFYRHRDVRPDAIFVPKLSNHDEKWRTASSLGRYMPKLKMAASILLTAPGRPFIYQGEELGYWGTSDDGDEYIRTPILWNTDISSAALAGVSNKYDKDMLKPGIAVTSQEDDESSLLMHYRRFAYARNFNSALATGHPIYDDVTSGNSAVLCWKLVAEDGSGKECLVIHNITESTQTIERAQGENLSDVVVASAPVVVNGRKVTLPPLTSVVFALN